MMQKSITINITADSPLEAKQKEKVLNDFINQPMEDQNRLIEIMGSRKALDALKKNWTMLKMMFK